MKVIKFIYLAIVLLGVLVMCIFITPISIVANFIGCWVNILNATTLNPKSLN